MDYLPRKDANLIVWLSNYKNKIVLHGSTIGLSATEITNEQAICDNMINSINNVANIRDQLKAAVAKKKTLIINNLLELFVLIFLGIKRTQDTQHPLEKI